MTYATQMDAARRGIVTPQMKIVAEKEKLAPETLQALIAAGKVIIPANRNHPNLDPEGVGQGLRTKINVNLGISKDCSNVDLELDKVRLALALKTEAIMDLSCFGKTREFRRRLVAISPAMIGTVPIYDAVGFYDKNLKDLTVDEIFEVVERHCEDGVDFLTIHAGLNRSAAEKINRRERITNIVSRGGSLMFTWMQLNDRENPFYEYYDRLLEICREYDVSLSLGDGCRPGCLHDSTDASQVEELITLGELTKQAWEQDVQVMIEGPGHMALNEIAGNMMLEKRLCHGAPFYVLGPHRYRRGARLRPHHQRHRRRRGRGQRRRFSLLRHPGRTFASARPGRHERGNHCHPHCRPRRRYCQGHSRCQAVGRRHGPGPVGSGLEADA